MKTLVALATLFPLVVLCGCGASSSLPTEDAAKKAVQEQIFDKNQNRLKLVSFQKTDGQSRAVNGVQAYQLKFEGEVEVTEDCIWEAIGRTNPQTGVLEDLVMQSGGSDRKHGVIPRDPKDIAKKGLKRKISGIVNYTKSEKGWTICDVGLWCL